MSLRYFLERLALIVNGKRPGKCVGVEEVAAVLCCWDETFFVLPGGGQGGDGSVRRKSTKNIEIEMNKSNDIQKLSRRSCINLDYRK